MPLSEPGADEPMLETLSFEDREVRMLLRDGNPWWVAKDVCEVLEIAESHRSLAALDDDEKGRHTVTTPGGPQEMAIINEPGLYSLVLRSRKPEAKRFKRWLTHDVIPAIRRHGCYRAGPRDLVREAELLLEVTRRQVAQEAEQARTRRLAQAAMDQASSNFGRYTVLGFARLHGLDLDVQQAAKHGRKLTRICEGLGAEIGAVTDPRFGRVNTYPEGVLADYFRSAGLLEAD